MNTILTRFSILIASLLLTACAASSLPGFQNTYQTYSVPQTLVERIKSKFHQYGLGQASVTRDSTGRIELTGIYRNEDEVDTAFTIVQSIIGIKSTSPHYPEHVLQKRWEVAAGQALGAYTRGQRNPSSPPVKRALVIGINHFADFKHLPDIQGADDAAVVQDYLRRAGYRVTTLLGKHATQANVEVAIARFDGEIGPNDDVFLYVSSHGASPVRTPDGPDTRKMSILVYDSGGAETMHFSKKEDFDVYLQWHSVPDTLVQALAKKPSHATRVVIDTCYSGNMFAGVPDESTNYILSVNGGRQEVEGISLASWTGPAYTSKGIRFSDDDSTSAGTNGTRTTLLDHIRSGYQLITATSPGEESLGPASGTFPSPLSTARVLKGSYFTQSLFEYLDHYQGRLGLAFRDAKDFTTLTARQVSGDEKRRQTPRQYSTIPDQQNNLFQ